MNKIIISATFPSDEYLDIIANGKGYQSTVQSTVEVDEAYEAYTDGEWNEVPAGTRKVTVSETIPNPQSREDFVRKVYEEIVINDVTSSVLYYNNNKKQAEKEAEENAVREAVTQSITSTVE